MAFITVYGLVGGFTLSHLDDKKPEGHPLVKKATRGKISAFYFA